MVTGDILPNSHLGKGASCPYNSRACRMRGSDPQESKASTVNIEWVPENIKLQLVMQDTWQQAKGRITDMAGVVDPEHHKK